jgi:hypothetical protein
VKTLEEAMLSATSLSPEDVDGMAFQNAIDLAKDVNNCPVAVDYVVTLVMLCMQARISDAEIDVLTSVAFTAFASGIRVGMEMGKTGDNLPS